MKIKSQVASNLKEIIDQDFETYSYSGRAMYGDRCLAFNISRDANPMGVVVQIVADFVSLFGDAELDELVSVFEQSRTDSMGLDSVLYFPAIKWLEEWEDGRTDDED
jgi:hypothetical protein